MLLRTQRARIMPGKKGKVSFMKRVLSLLLVLCLLAAACPPLSASAAGKSFSSGCEDVPKLSMKEIVALLQANPKDTPAQAGEIYDVQPSVSAPYAAGKVKQALLEKALGRLNALRRIAGLPAVQLDQALCENAQYGAVLLAASSFSHYPAKPEDMDQDFYDQGRSATSSSNINAGRGLVATPDGFMFDSDQSNISRVGHRRWQLNPYLGKVGFGYAVTSKGYGSYTAEKVFDRSGTAGDYDFISWPSSGYFPTELSASEYGRTLAWSVTLNPAKYSAPQRADLTVTLKHENDGRVWSFSGAKEYAASDAGEYLNLEQSGYGVNNCIIFRPADVRSYQGRYTVTIDGLKDAGGEPVAFSYRVDFFSLSNPTHPLFSDVSGLEYYYDAVDWAQDSGVTTGRGGGRFQPDGVCKRAEIVTFLWRAMGCPTPQRTTNPFVDVKESDYFYQAALWAEENGVTSGKKGGYLKPLDTCTRGEAVTFLYRAAMLGVAVPAAPDTVQTFSDVEPGRYYSWPVQWAVAHGVTSGKGRGMFKPGDSCKRGEIVTFLYRALPQLPSAAQGGDSP